MDNELSNFIDSLLNLAGDIIREEKEKLISKKELQKITYGQFHFIDAISEIENSTISSLSKKMNITKPSVTVGIQKMEKNGLIYKEQSKTDRRISYIHLTDKGKLIKKAEYNSLHRMERSIKSKLNDSELKSLLSILSKISRS